jgi:hypothetical protein
VLTSSDIISPWNRKNSNQLPIADKKLSFFC